MRDDFTPATKKRLASRVAYKCCFPNCPCITVGPNSLSDEDFFTTGEAAHIHAASKGGPRYLPEMTSKERKSINNGIWMCRNHAKLIDADFVNYSADTLKQWKINKEAQIYNQLKDLDPDCVDYSTTLISLDLDLIFEGLWKAVDNDRWTIVVKKFIKGNEIILKERPPKSDLSPMFDYIIIESQGDARLLKEGFKWRINDDKEYEIQVNVWPKTRRVTPNEIGRDLAFGSDNDLIIENGDFKIISGIELAIQLIGRNLSMPFGSWIANPLLGSFFSYYYHEMKGDKQLLNRFIKLEITRLVAIPAYQMTPEINPPELNFINRVINVNVGEVERNKVPVELSLEWGDRSLWTGTIDVFLSPRAASFPSLNIEEPSDLAKVMFNTMYK